MSFINNKNIFFVVLIIAAAQAKAQTKYAAIDALINKSHQLGLFNGNVLIIDQGKEVYRKAIGYADATRQTLLTDKYRFHIGSIAKEFNATAIMMLKEQGKLAVDDKISKYLTGLPAWAQTISIKNLLQYTSGLPDLKWKNITNDAAARDSLKKITKLDFEPGTRYAYNNSNTFLQRQIVAKITGMSFTAFVMQKMLQPLKMTSALVDPGENAPLMAKSYSNSGVQSPMATPISGWTALTLDDFYKWEQSLEYFSLISAASVKELLTPFAANRQCGLGGGEMDGDKLVRHIHDGTALNYQALLTAHTEIGRTVILMTNNKQNVLYDINGAIQNILDGRPYVQPKKQVITALQDKLDNATGTRLLTDYQQLKIKYPGDYNFDTETALNTVGYALLNKKNYEAAIAVFEYNTSLFPKSGNVFDSLAEAYETKGDKAKALINYRKSVELDSSNDSAKEKIITLER